jgi:glycosyltransferase involved in cell wall biosynthesis
MKLGSMLNEVDADVLEIHRIESLLRIRRNSRPVTAVLHQNMQSLYDKQADIRWARFPGMYFWLEDKLAPRLQSAFCVREDAAEHYRSRYENLAERCEFQPTWADPRQFKPPSESERHAARARISLELGLNDDSRWLLMVGRLDAQKNPMLLLAALQRLVESGQHDISLLIVGEGQLRSQMEGVIEQTGLAGRIRLLGLKSIDEVAGLLHAADLFVMSSAYEGMPMAVIEALASGVPVATTRVGEVALVLRDGVCGRIAESDSEEHLAGAISWCLDNLDKISGTPCTQSASRFSPAVVLESKYENYRKLAANSMRLE